MSERTVDVKVRACPRCGATELGCSIILETQQTPEGNWELQIPQQEDIDFAVDNVNNEVVCLNDQCGNPYDSTGKEIVLDGEVEDYFTYWVRKVSNISEVDYLHVTAASLTTGDREKFEEWYNSLTWIPWRGALAETILLQ